jgi:competence CoiA-like predicted nuclease
MTYAVDDKNELFEATPKTRLKCPNCKKEVFSRCGEIRVWHWAHHVNESCEYSKIKDSSWRYEWIKKTSKEKVEKLVNGQVVDILGNNDAKVLFIGCKLSEQDIIEKESAFKNRIIWVLKSDEFKQLKIYRKDNDDRNGHYCFEWKKARIEWTCINRKISFLFFDVGEEKEIYSRYNGFRESGYLKNRLLYVKQFSGDEYEIFGEVVEIDEEFFINRYL